MFFLFFFVRFGTFSCFSLIPVHQTIAVWERGDRHADEAAAPGIPLYYRQFNSIEDYTRFYCVDTNPTRQ